MGFNLTVVNSCTLVSINAKSFTGATTATITIEDISTNAGSTTYTLNYTGGNLTGNMNVLVSGFTAQYGVFKACLSEGGIIQSCKPIIIHCDIDCCLVKLTNELIDCACDCPKCASALAKAQKVFLLLQAANSAKELATANSGATSNGYYLDMAEKYLKAREICDNSCGCDC